MASDDRQITAVAPDGSLYPIDKMEAHRIGALHLAISAFIFAPNAQGDDELLIQRRAPGKYHCGGLWANSCCSHPDWGETVADAAHRRLSEEMGQRTELTQTAVIDYRAEVGQGLIENERVHIFIGRLPSQKVKLAPDPMEVSETRWDSVENLMQDAADHPENYAPWFRIYLSRWNELELSTKAATA